MRVTMTRTGYSVWAGATLALSPLVIDSDPNSGAYHLTEEDQTWPNFPMRRTYAPSSEVISGQSLKAATPDLGQIGLRISAHAANWTDLLAARNALADCTSQFTYSLTLEVYDGAWIEVGTYEAHSELPLWGAVDSGEVKAKLNDATITIPLNPPGSA